MSRQVGGPSGSRGRGGTGRRGRGRARNTASRDTSASNDSPLQFRPSVSSTPYARGGGAAGPAAGSSRRARPLGSSSSNDWEASLNHDDGGDSDGDDGDDNRGANRRDGGRRDPSSSSRPRRDSSSDSTGSPRRPPPSPSRPGPSSGRAGPSGAGRRKPAKPTRSRPGVKALKEIRHYRRTTELLIAALPFCRVVKEVSDAFVPRGHTGYRWKKTALQALQESAEAFMVQHFEISNMLTLHAKRVTLMNKDIRLATDICGFFSSLYRPASVVPFVR